MRRISTAVLLSAGLFASACAPDPQPPEVPEIVEIAPNGAWTWFNDERAIRLTNGNLLVGYVRDDGHAAVTNFDPATGERHEMVLGGDSAVEVDDHDNPSLVLLPDGRVLAIYSRHHTDTHFFWRISSTPDPRTAADWGEERMKDVGVKNTYANAFRLSGAGDSILNFHRAINFNPTLTISTDLGESWGDPIHFITAGTGGQRPYPRYVSNNVDRIDLIYTDAHPRNLDNSIYHLFYRDGAFRHSDGSVVRTLDDLPIAHDAGERGTLVYGFSADPWGPGEGPDDRMPGGRGWTWDIVYGEDERPVIAFQVRRGEVTGDAWTDARIYYYYARWTGREWEKHFIAHAGRPLYEREQDYAGGIAIDPQDPNVVYLSTNALRPFDLATIDDVPLSPGDRYTLYRGVTRDGGRTFDWTELTPDDTADNLRPHAIQSPGSPTAVVWFRGRYTTYMDFQAAVMGMVAVGE